MGAAGTDREQVDGAGQSAARMHAIRAFLEGAVPGGGRASVDRTISLFRGASHDRAPL
jgi:hypothetical protein